MMHETVVVPPSFIEKMLDHAKSSKPNECCGVLGGRGSIITSVHPLKNQANSSTKFFAEPKDLIDAARKIRTHQEEMIGIYHSHPDCPAEPSQTDQQENEYPGSYYFIISLKDQEPDIQCYIMNEQRNFRRIEMI